MFHEYGNAPLCSTFLSSPSIGQQQVFPGGCHDEQAWSSFHHDDDSRLSSSEFASRLSPLPSNHKRPLPASESGSEDALSPPPTRRLPKHPARKAAPVPEFAKAFLRAWYNKNRKDPRLSDADKKALAQLTELPEEQVAQWVKIARSQTVVTSLCSRPHSPTEQRLTRSFPHPDFSDYTAPSPFLPEPHCRRSSFSAQPPQLLGGAVPENTSGYFSSSMQFPPRFGDHPAPPQPVAGLQSPFKTSPTEMQRYSLSNSSAGGSSIMYDNFSNSGSKHTSATSLYSTDNGNGLHFVAAPQQPTNAYLTPSDDLNLTPGNISATESPPPAVLDRPYKCTYGCGGDSQNKSDWKRHEETHEPQKEYICLLNTPGWIVTPDDPTTIECQFCTKRFPASSQPQMESHLSVTHLVSRCLSTQVSHRTPFKRPDHLHQHLKTHHPSPRSTHWKTWNRPTATRKSGWGCGFCGAFLRSWAERVDHVGEHFKRGGIGYREWDVGKVVAGLLSGVAGVKDSWVALVKGDGAEGWQWDGRDARVIALREKLENASSHNPDALALEARNLTISVVVPNTSYLATPTSASTTTSFSSLSPTSLHFINPFDYSPPSTPHTPYDPSFQDFDDVLTYYNTNNNNNTNNANAAYDRPVNANRNHNISSLQPINTSLMCPPSQLSASSAASSTYLLSHAGDHMMASTMADDVADGCRYNMSSGHRLPLSLMIPGIDSVNESDDMDVLARTKNKVWNEISGDIHPL
ncbi:MAG: hypothetical protein M1840_008321 [Geoglossum simile]|nr:MAG: hypothetical protein M1840_008321 [Geoglossum simile]